MRSMSAEERFIDALGDEVAPDPLAFYRASRLAGRSTPAKADAYLRLLENRGREVIHKLAITADFFDDPDRAALFVAVLDSMVESTPPSLRRVTYLAEQRFLDRLMRSLTAEYAGRNADQFAPLPTLRARVLSAKSLQWAEWITDSPVGLLVQRGDMRQLSGALGMRHTVLLAAINARTIVIPVLSGRGRRETAFLDSLANGMQQRDGALAVAVRVQKGLESAVAARAEVLGTSHARAFMGGPYLSGAGRRSEGIPAPLIVQQAAGHLGLFTPPANGGFRFVDSSNSLGGPAFSLQPPA